MRGTVGEHLIEQLYAAGIEHCFGVPGSYNLNFYNKLYKSKIKVVGTTDEESAGFAADAYARVKGLGCVCVTYCVGGFKVANATACAYAERSPVVVISGSPGVKERDGNVLLHHMVGHFECQHKTFEQITCANTVLRDPEHAGYEIARVLSAAKEYKQPVYIELPRDVVDQPIGYDVFTQLTPKERKTDEHSLREAVTEVAAWLNEAKRPVIWAGVECARFGLAKKLIRFAEQTNIPVATTILGKSVVNERHPLSLGVYCEGTADDALCEFMSGCDCLIMLGVMMTDMNAGFLPLRCNHRHVVNASTKELQVRSHSFDGVKFADFCEALFKSAVARRPNTSLPKVVKEQYVPRQGKITAQRLFDKINSVLEPNMAIVADIGDSLFGALGVTVDSHHFVSDAFYASMGFAVPAALGVAAGSPGTRPVVVVGDGAFQMTGTEFSTLVRNGIPAIVFVLNNSGYGTERLIIDGPFNDVQPWNYHNIPSLVGGGVGYKVETEEELETAVEAALKLKDRPAIINVVVGHDYTPALRKMFSKLKTKGA